MNFDALKKQHGEDAAKEAFMLGVIQGLKQAQEWRPIETAPSDTEVRVGWYEDGEWYESIDTFEAGEFWISHATHYEHFCAVRIPEMTGPKETPPYTHWIPLATPPQEQQK